jgi:hypothetical protein
LEKKKEKQLVAYKIEIEEDADKTLGKLPKKEQSKIEKKIKSLANNPRPEGAIYKLILKKKRPCFLSPPTFSLKSPILPKIQSVDFVNMSILNPI